MVIFPSFFFNLPCRKPIALAQILCLPILMETEWIFFRVDKEDGRYSFFQQTNKQTNSNLSNERNKIYLQKIEINSDFY